MEFLTVAPSSYDPERLGEFQGKRAAEVCRFYETTFGEKSELEIGHWLCGGEDGSRRMLDIVKRRLSDGPASISEIYETLSLRGYSDLACETMLRWLLVDGYVKVNHVDGVWRISVTSTWK